MISYINEIALYKLSLVIYMRISTKYIHNMGKFPFYILHINGRRKWESVQGLYYTPIIFLDLGISIFGLKPKFNWTNFKAQSSENQIETLKASSPVSIVSSSLLICWVFLNWCWKTREGKQKVEEMALVWLEAALPLGIIAGMLCVAGNIQYFVHKAYHGRVLFLNHILQCLSFFCCFFFNWRLFISI